MYAQKSDELLMAAYFSGEIFPVLSKRFQRSFYSHIFDESLGKLNKCENWPNNGMITL